MGTEFAEPEKRPIKKPEQTVPQPLSLPQSPPPASRKLPQTQEKAQPSPRVIPDPNRPGYFMTEPRQQEGGANESNPQRPRVVPDPNRPGYFMTEPRQRQSGASTFDPRQPQGRRMVPDPNNPGGYIYQTGTPEVKVAANRPDSEQQLGQGSQPQLIAQATPNPQPSRINHGKPEQSDSVTFTESNIPFFGRHQLSGTKGNDVINVSPTNKPGLYEVTVENQQGQVIGKRYLTEDQLKRTDIHGGQGDDLFKIETGKIPSSTKLYGDSGDDAVNRTAQNKEISFDGGKGTDWDATLIQRAPQNSLASDNYQVQYEVNPGTPEWYAHGFEKRVALNAQKRLANNSARLKSEQKGFENLSPSNAKWSQLRQLAQQDQALEQHKRALNQQIADLRLKDSGQFRLRNPNPALSESDFDKIGDPKIAAQVQGLETQQAMLASAQRKMRVQSPALAVVDTAMVAKSKNTQANNQALQQTINSGFGQVQQSITELRDQIREDPDRAMALDDVRSATLAQMKVNPNKPNSDQARAIASYLHTQKIQKLGGDLLTGGLTAGAIIGSMVASEGAAWPFWVGAAGTASGVATGILDYKELSTIDLAAQAQQGGAGALTSKDKDTARFELIMGQTNLLMAGLDLGLTAKATVGLLKSSSGAAAVFSKLKPAQVKQFAEATQLEQAGKAAEAEGLFQKLYKQIGEKASQRIREIRANRLMNPTDPNAGAIFPGNSKKLAGQRIAAMSEDRALEVGQRLERIDGGHSLDRHGAQVTPQQLDQRLKTGIAPDGVVSSAPASTRFDSNKNWLLTRQQAFESLRAKYGDLVGNDLRKPPSPNDKTTLDIQIKYDSPIDDGFIPDKTTKSKTKVFVDPATGKPTTDKAIGQQKSVNVYGKTESIEDVTGVFTRFAWNAAEKRWKMVQHFPIAEGWDDVAKTYKGSITFDAAVELDQ
jgi:hypothetical protein